MSQFKVEFTLKQHTPMIHFQSHEDKQNGATIRASELKPKLDKFLLKSDKSLSCKETPNGELYLDYKVQIIVDPSKVEFSIINAPDKDKNGQQKRSDKNELKWLSYPGYFANLGDNTGKKHKYFSISKVPIQIIFHSFDVDLLKAIATHFAEFLLKHNFGARQTKGFGSFYIDVSDKRHYIDPSKVLEKNPSFGVVEKSEKTLFQNIDWFYKSLRSGINMKDSSGDTTYYFKAVSYMYAKDQGMVWDKRAIKQKFISKNILDKQIEDHGKVDILTDEVKNAKLVRDLLGLSSSQSWGKKELTKESEKIGKEALIARMKSPLLFKPIKTNAGFRVFLVPYAIKSAIYNQKFFIYFDEKGPLELTTPMDKDFKLGKFFDFAKNINVDQHVEQKYHQDKDNIHKTLRSIYTDLKPKAKK